MSALVLTPLLATLALLLALAGVRKLRDPGPTVNALAEAHVPAHAVRLLGLGEAAIGVSCLLAPAAAAAALALEASYGIFAVTAVVGAVRATWSP